jgi:oxaloacetate decarboxylase alpha subunit
MARRAPKRWRAWPALRHLAIDGLPTTAPLHRRILADPRFIAGGVDTGFLAGLNRSPAMTAIRLVDVTMRDGNQSLWGPPASTPRTCSSRRADQACGFAAIDFTSSSHMAVAVRYFRNNPWERLRRMAAAMPTTPLQFITTGLRFIAWQQADPEFMRLVYRTLQTNGVGRFVLLDPMHEVPAVIEAARLVKQEGGARSWRAHLHAVEHPHRWLLRRFRPRPGAVRRYRPVLYQGSGRTAVGGPVRTLVPAVKAAIGNRRWKSTPIPRSARACFRAWKRHGWASPRSMSASAGWRRLFAARGEPDAGQPGGSGAHGGHRQGRAGAADAYWTRLALPKVSPGQPQNFDASFLRHQIAGGVMTTTARQLDELGLSDRLGAVIAETGQVRAELGYPIMVTPFPQMVMSQALFNVIGDRRYAQVSDQVVRYCLGKFGKPTSPIDPQVLATIMDRPARANWSTSRPSPPWPTCAASSACLSDEEFLLRAVMPPEQVDAMQAAGVRAPPIRPGRAAARPAAPARRAARARDLVVERPGFRLALHAGASLHDHLEGSSARLRDAAGFVFDMDGTIALGDAKSGGQGPATGPAGNAGAARHALCGLHQRHGQGAGRLCRLAAQGGISGGAMRRC